MAINSVSLNNEISNIASTKASSATTDTGSKNIQNQIASKQQRLNRISSNQEMSKEEKAKERQEIQKQIEELNRKLKLLRLEEQKEAEKAKKEQEQKAVLNEEMKTKTNTVSKENNTNETTSETQEERMEQLNAIGTNIHKILVADATLQKNRIKNSVKMQKETTINIMESEIKMDELHGNENKAKKEELAALMNKTTFEIQDKKPPKTQTVSGMNENAKVIIVE